MLNNICAVLSGCFLFCLPCLSESGPLIFSLSCGASTSSLWDRGKVHDIQNLYNQFDETNFQPATSPLYHFTCGISISNSMNKNISLGLDWNYRYKGVTFKLNPAYSDSIIGTIQEQSIGLDYLTIPLRVVYYMSGYHLLFPYVYAGVYGGLLLDANARSTGSKEYDDHGNSYMVTTREQISLNDHIRSFDAGIVGGVGGEIGLGIRGLFFEIGGEWGLIDITNRPKNYALFTEAMRTMCVTLLIGYEIRVFSY